MVRGITWALGTAALLAASAAFAADVKITGIHNCCGQCNTTIKATLDGAGATNVQIKPGEVTFSAGDAAKAVTALYDAGYSGKVEGAATPAPKGVQGVKGKEIKVEGVHLCCGQCVKSVNTALKDIGTTNAKARDTAFVVTAATEVEAAAVVKALRDAGFNARVVK